MCHLRSALFLLLAVSWLASGATGARNRLLDGNDPLGSPGELAWQAWLLMDASATGGVGGGSGAAGESTGARRITPKSVFIAPAFSPQSLPACAEGTRRDAAGRCVQLVPVNREAQLSFLLQRLNALHARPPAPLRFPLPLPARGGAPGPAPAADSGPLKVPLNVPPATPAPAAPSLPATPEPAPDVPATTEATTTTSAPASSTNPPSGTSTVAPAVDSAPDPAFQNDGEDEPVRVSVVMADLTKRNSGEGDDNGKGQDDNDRRPLITVWTIENDTLHKSHGADGADSTFVVEINSTTEAAASSEDISEHLEPQQAPGSVLAPATVAGELPMLVISPGTTLSATSTTSRPDGENDLVAENVEGSGALPYADAGDRADSSKVVQLEEAGTLDGDMASSTEQGDDLSETTMKGNDDEKEAGSADIMEHIEVVPISEHSRHNLPILSDDQDSSFTQSGASDGLSGLIRPVPLGVIRGSQAQEDSEYRNPVRFPSESSDEPHTVHLFKGNYIKFPTENAYRYKHKTETEPLTDVKQSFWWLPSGWRVEQQRHQPALQDFWSRMPLSEDPALLSRYNPAYHSPLPYQQRQAQYDPEWASMKRHMSS